ncbi:MAG: M48 family metalloprotease [Ignavibacteriaceae bacterium]|jgi:predicted Zn-dependent protease|nr:M48 family metalloprotease [Ignavibacteriaceae bacterium]
MKKNSINLFLSFFSVVIISSCSGSGGFNMFSDSEDVKLGHDVSAEMLNNQKEYPVFRGDPSIKSYIDQRIFQQILTSPKIAKRSVYDYKIELIADDNTLNAFALPGGNVYIYSGLLKFLDSEAALAGVLGHEIAHAERRHATQRMTKYYGVEFLVGMILGSQPSKVAEVASNLFVGLAFLANSRADEDEADKYSIDYLKDTRFYPGSVKFFFEEMRDDGLIGSKSNKVATFLSTHPDPVNRIAKTNERLQSSGIAIKDWKSNDANLFKNEYAANIKNKLPK